MEIDGWNLMGLHIGVDLEEDLRILNETPEQEQQWIENRKRELERKYPLDFEEEMRNRRLRQEIENRRQRKKILEQHKEDLYLRKEFQKK